MSPIRPNATTKLVTVAAIGLFLGCSAEVWMRALPIALSAVRWVGYFAVSVVVVAFQAGVGLGALMRRNEDHEAKLLGACLIATASGTAMALAPGDFNQLFAEFGRVLDQRVLFDDPLQAFRPRVAKYAAMIGIPCALAGAGLWLTNFAGKRRANPAQHTLVVLALVIGSAIIGFIVAKAAAAGLLARWRFAIGALLLLPASLLAMASSKPREPELHRLHWAIFLSVVVLSAAAGATGFAMANSVPPTDPDLLYDYDEPAD